MTFVLCCHNRRSRIVTKPLSLVLGYALEVVVGSGILFVQQRAISPTSAGLGAQYEYRELEDLEAGRICYG
jgi:hypothetical protein